MKRSPRRRDDAVSADFHLGSLQGRKTLRGEEDAPQQGGLPVRVSPTKAQVASDEKACVSLLNEGIHINYTFQTASRADHCDPRGFVQEEIMKKM